MRFLGREQELDLLRAAWRECLYGQVRIVGLVAESRMGKTRLVQEFYHWLNRYEDTDNYWPDTLSRTNDSLHINPVLETITTSQATPPWLWWGIRWTNPSLRNPGETAPCGVLAASAHLQPHVEIARRKQMQRAAQRQALVGVGKTVANLATAGVIGPALEIIERIQDWRSLSNARGPEDSTIQTRQHEERESELSRMSDLLISSVVGDGLSPGGVPLILIVDDVHWADKESLRFIYGLIAGCSRTASARKDRAPRVLIIATCWEREWNAAAERPADLEISSFRDVGRCLERDALEAARPRTILQECRLLPLSDDLQGAVADELPGLTPAQQQLVAVRAGGSPGLLQELLLKLKGRSRHFFERSDPGSALTPRGEIELRTMTVSHHELVEERLTALTELQTLILQVASHFGLRFIGHAVIELAQRLADELDLDAAECDAALRQADRPLALVQETAHQVIEFRLPIYHEVLQRWLSEHEDRLLALRKHSLDLIARWLETGKTVGLTGESRRAFVSFAAAELRRPELAQDAHRRLQLLWVDALEIDDLVATGRAEDIEKLVINWFARTARYELHTWELGRQLVASVCWSAFELEQYATLAQFVNDQLTLLDVGPASEARSGLRCMLLRLSLALRCATESIDACEPFLTRALTAIEADILRFGATAERLRDRYAAHGYRARLLKHHGDAAGAERQLREATDAVDKHIEAFGGTPHLLRDAWIFRNELAALHLDNNAHASALELYEQSIQLCQRALHDFGLSPQRLQDMQRARSDAAWGYEQDGQIDKAIALCRAAADDARNLIERFGVTKHRLRATRDAKTHLARVLLAAGSTDESLRLYRESLGDLETADQRTVCDPPSLQYAHSQRLQGAQALVRSERFSEGLTLLTEARQLCEKSLREFGESDAVNGDLFDAIIRIAEAHCLDNSAAPALTAAREALALCKPDPPLSMRQHWNWNAARARHRCGDALLVQDRYSDALPYYSEALRLVEQYIAEFGEDRLRANRRVELQARVARCTEHVDTTLAITQYRRALSLSRQTAAQFEPNSYRSRIEAQAAENAAHLLESQGQRAEAFDLIRAAASARSEALALEPSTLNADELARTTIEVARHVYACNERARAANELEAASKLLQDRELDPDLSPGDLTRFADIAQSLAQELTAQGRHLTAAPQWERVVQTYRSLLNLSPNEESHSSSLASALLSYGDSLAAIGNAVAAHRNFEEARAVQEELIVALGESRDRLRNVYIALDRYAVHCSRAGDYARAEQLHRSALDVLRRLSEKYGATAVDQSCSLIRLADLLNRRGDDINGLQALRDALAISKAAISRADDHDVVTNYVSAALRIANQLDDDVQGPEISELLQAALHACEDVIGRFGKNEQIDYSLYLTLCRMADHASQDRPHDARILFGRALMVAAESVRRYGETLDRERCHWVVQFRLADLDERAGSQAIAYERYTRVSNELDRLIARFGGTSTLQQDQFQSRRAVTRCMPEEIGFEQRRAANEDLVELSLRLLHETQPSVDSLRNAFVALRDLGELLWKHGHREHAATALKNAIEYHLDAIARFGRTDDRLRQLYPVYLLHAKTVQASGHMAAARSSYLAAADLMEGLCGIGDDATTVQVDLCRGLLGASKCRSDTDNPDKDGELSARGLAAVTKLASIDPAAAREFAGSFGGTSS